MIENGVLFYFVPTEDHVVTCCKRLIIISKLFKIVSETNASLTPLLKHQLIIQTFTHTVTKTITATNRYHPNLPSSHHLENKHYLPLTIINDY